VLVLGGTSDIGVAIAGALVGRGANAIVLAGRDPVALVESARTLESPSVSVSCVSFDATVPTSHHEVIRHAVERVGDLSVVVVAVGVLADEKGVDADPVAVADAVSVNMGGTMAALTVAASRLRDQGHGILVVLSSVAGFLVRSDNPIYGASKAGLDAYACAIGELLRPFGVSVLVVRPGFVRTSMTAGMAERPMTIAASDVARAVVSAMHRDGGVVWVPRIAGVVFPLLRASPAGVRRFLLERTLAHADNAPTVDAVTRRPGR